jgi:hypothetical protein
LQLINPSTSPNELNTTLTPHSIIHGDACFAYFNKIWGIPVADSMVAGNHALSIVSATETGHALTGVMVRNTSGPLKHASKIVNRFGIPQ